MESGTRVEYMDVASGCGEQKMGVASGSHWEKIDISLCRIAI